MKLSCSSCAFLYRENCPYPASLCWWIDPYLASLCWWIDVFVDRRVQRRLVSSLGKYHSPRGQRLFIFGSLASLHISDWYLPSPGLEPWAASSSTGWRSERSKVRRSFFQVGGRRSEVGDRWKGKCLRPFRNAQGLACPRKGNIIKIQSNRKILDILKCECKFGLPFTTRVHP